MCLLLVIPVNGSEKVVGEVDTLEVLEMRELLVVEGCDLVVGQVQRLESVVAPKSAGTDVRDVVVAQVQLHHDLQVLEGVHVNFLEEKEKRGKDKR